MKIYLLIFMSLVSVAMWGQGKPLLCNPENAKLLNDLIHDRSAFVRQHFQPIADQCKLSPKPAVSSDKRKHPPMGTIPNEQMCANCYVPSQPLDDPGIYQHVSNWKTDPQCVFNSQPAPKPSFIIEKAVLYDLFSGCTGNGIFSSRPFECKDGIAQAARCNGRLGYATFLLPDESTGEKMCLIFPTDSGRTKEQK